MPRWDFECGRCGCQLTDHTDPKPNCPDCWNKDRQYVPMIKHQPAPNFTIRGFNAKNGYSK